MTCFADLRSWISRVALSFWFLVLVYIDLVHAIYSFQKRSEQLLLGHPSRGQFSQIPCYANRPSLASSINSLLFLGHTEVGVLGDDRRPLRSYYRIVHTIPCQHLQITISSCKDPESDAAFTSENRRHCLRRISSTSLPEGFHRSQSPQIPP